MLFEKIRSQDGPVLRLKRALERKRIPTAYLFTGPEGCGRTMAAVATAASLNCLTDPIACGTCPSCLLYAAGSHPDLHVIAPQEGKRQILIQQIREQVLERAWLKPMSGATSTFIVQEANLMNVNASNAFLKTLEEPPVASHFILLAPDRGSVLPTVASRCQTMAFSPLPRSTVESLLLEDGVERQDAERLAAMARGSVKKAHVYHSSGALEELAGEFDSLSSLHRLGVGQLLDLSQRWGKNRQDALGVLELMAQWYRDMMILAEGVSEDQVINASHIPALRKGGEIIGGPSLAQILESVEDAREAIDANTNVQLTLDTLLLRVRKHTMQPEKSA